MDPEFEGKQLDVFAKMVDKADVKKGMIYRQKKPVYWSPSSQTALAEAELEYDDNHKVTAAFMLLPLSTTKDVLLRKHCPQIRNYCKACQSRLQERKLF
ncbi:hypothetical protein LTR28_002388 [Elasticomyces elasticus]|nr:hypothetical protein LTR28_002388 [Elasticomyces elasticus]